MTAMRSRRAVRGQPEVRPGESIVDNMLTQERGDRPGGVTFIALLVDFAGLIIIFVVILSLLGLTSPQIQSRHADVPAAVAALAFHGLLGVAYVVVAAGLWRLRLWAFWAAIALSVLVVANDVFSFWEHYLTTPLTIVGGALPIVILLYFALSRSARRAFGV